MSIPITQRRSLNRRRKHRQSSLRWTSRNIHICPPSATSHRKSASQTGSHPLSSIGTVNEYALRSRGRKGRTRHQSRGILRRSIQIGTIRVRRATRRISRGESAIGKSTSRPVAPTGTWWRADRPKIGGSHGSSYARARHGQRHGRRRCFKLIITIFRGI